jgi:hypothetical protein
LARQVNEESKAAKLDLEQTTRVAQPTVEYDGEEVGIWWRGSALAPGWRCGRYVAAFGACEAKKDGAASWAEPKLSRPVLGVVDVRRNGGEVPGRRVSAVGARLFGGVRMETSRGMDAKT